MHTYSSASARQLAQFRPAGGGDEASDSDGDGDGAIVKELASVRPSPPPSSLTPVAGIFRPLPGSRHFKFKKARFCLQSYS